MAANITSFMSYLTHPTHKRGANCRLLQSHFSPKYLSRPVLVTSICPVPLSYQDEHFIFSSLFQAPREKREGEGEGTKTRVVFVPSPSPSRVSLGAWNRLHLLILFTVVKIYHLYFFVLILLHLLLARWLEFIDSFYSIS